MRGDWIVSGTTDSLAGKLGHALVVAAAAVTAALGLMPCDARADDRQFTEQQILDALKARRLTRCPHPALSGCGEPREDKTPEIDFEILFDYGSARLNGGAKSSILVGLSADLGKPEAKHAYLLVAGYTDAKGSARYNQILSERRAEAVKRYLAEQFKLAPEQLRAIGFGKAELKNAGDPFSGENRRVQIVNTGHQSTAGGS